MEALPRMAIQVGIILIPVAVFLLLKKKATSRVVQFGASACLAILAGVVAYYFAAEYQWQPFGKKDTEEVMLSPLITSAIMGVTVFMALMILTISKRWPLSARKSPNQSSQPTPLKRRG
jgi:H+/Cl- antiporter ClcA